MTRDWRTKLSIGMFLRMCLRNRRSRELTRISVYADHSIFAEPNSPGQQDLRSLLRAYSNFAPWGYRPEMARIAGALLIHCVVEDAFWLLSGLVNGVLKECFMTDRWGMRVDARVFEGVLGGSEGKLGKLMKEIGLDCEFGHMFGCEVGWG
jgi:hypothetical protein